MRNFRHVDMFCPEIDCTGTLGRPVIFFSESFFFQHKFRLMSQTLQSLRLNDSGS